MTRLTFIPAQFIRVATAYRLDLNQCIVGGVHIVNNVGTVRLWRVSLPDFRDLGEIEFVNAVGKDDSVALEILASGDVLVTICEAAPDGGGVTSQPDIRIIPGVFHEYVTVDKLARNVERSIAKVIDAALNPKG